MSIACPHVYNVQEIRAKKPTLSSVRKGPVALRNKKALAARIVLHGSAARRMERL